MNKITNYPINRGLTLILVLISGAFMLRPATSQTVILHEDFENITSGAIKTASDADLSDIGLDSRIGYAESASMAPHALRSYDYFAGTSSCTNSTKWVSLSAETDGSDAYGYLYFTVDLSAHAASTELELQFRIRDMGEESDLAGGVPVDQLWVSFDAGDTWWHGIIASCGITSPCTYTQWGDMGSSWVSFTVDVDALAAAAGETLGTVIFTFDEQDNYAADGASCGGIDGIGIDDILLIDKAVTPVTDYPYTMDFEIETGQSTTAGDQGFTFNNGWTNGTNGMVDDIDWRSDYGGTPSTPTGPGTGDPTGQADHNPGTEFGLYMYLEASSGNDNKIGALISREMDFSALKYPTISFWYNMYGASMGSLDVSVSTDGGASYGPVLWSVLGDQGQGWFEVKVDLVDYAGLPSVFVKFNGRTGPGWESDIALDDILVKETCPFANGTISGTSSIGFGESTALTVSGSPLGTIIQWQYRETGGSSWRNAGNTSAASGIYNTAYLGKNMDFRAKLTYLSDVCYTDLNGTTGESDNQYAVTVTDNSAGTVWTGATSSNWSTASNWSNGEPSGSVNKVYIGNEYGNGPELTDAEDNLIIASLDIQADATLKNSIAAPQNPQITDYLTNHGTITQTGAGWAYLIGGGSTNSITNTGDASSLIFEVGFGTVTAGSALNVNAVLVSGGTLDMDNKDLTASNGVQVTGGSLELGTGAWNVTGGNVSISGSGGFDATASTLTLSGSSEQIVSTNGNEILNMVVNNSSGIKLGDNMQIDGTLTLTSGSINTDGNRLTMTSTSAGDLSGYSNSNFIIATQAGPFRRYIGNNTSNYVFPMGLGSGSTNYYRMDLRNGNLTNGGTLWLDVYVKSITEGGNNIDANIVTTQSGTAIVDMVAKEWMIVPNIEPTTGTFDLKLYIENLIASEGLEDNKFTVFKREDGSANYADYNDGASTSTTIPTHGAAGRVTTGSEPYASKNGFEPPMAGASVGKSNDNLPIELLDFDAESNDIGSVDITWATASEINNELFTIERSVDGVDFAPILERDGAGHSNHIIEYAAVDHNPLLGTSYYRLKQTDYDGSYEYSKMAVVTISESSSFRVWPNPATDHLQVQLDALEGISNLKIYNDEGRLVYEKEMDGSFSRLDIDLSGFDQGLYFITYAHDGVITKKRFIKN